MLAAHPKMLESAGPNYPVSNWRACAAAASVGLCHALREENFGDPQDAAAVAYA